MYSDALTGTLSRGVVLCVCDQVKQFNTDMCFVSLVIIVNELSADFCLLKIWYQARMDDRSSNYQPSDNA